MWNIKDITITALFTAICSIFGMFAHINFMGGIYLLPLLLIISSLLLKMQSIIIVTILSVIFTDLYSGWIGFVWISLLAYVPSMIIIKLFQRNKYGYFVGILIGMAWLTITYYLLTLVVDKAASYGILISTLIQSGISIGISYIIYLPTISLRKAMEQNGVIEKNRRL